MSVPVDERLRDGSPRERAGVAAAAIRLFCLPYAGGRASVFWNWPAALPASVDVRAIEYPGRGSRRDEPLRVDVASLAEDALWQVRPFLDRPLALFGHSMGASVAFELARRLATERGIEPVRLYLSARRAPHVPDRRPRAYALPEPELLTWLRTLNGTPEQVFEHDELLRLTLPILRADLQAAQTYTYHPGHRLSCPIVIFGGLDDAEVGPRDLEAWRAHTSGPFERHMLAGNHFFLQTNHTALMAWLTADLGAAVAAARLASGGPSACDPGGYVHD